MGAPQPPAEPILISALKYRAHAEEYGTYDGDYSHEYPGLCASVGPEDKCLWHANERPNEEERLNFILLMGSQAIPDTATA